MSSIAITTEPRNFESKSLFPLRSLQFSASPDFSGTRSFQIVIGGNMSSQVKARIAGFCYLMTFVGGGIVLAVRGAAGSAGDLVAGLAYMPVTLLFYDMF